MSLMQPDSLTFTLRLNEFIVFRNGFQEKKKTTKPSGLGTKTTWLG